VVLKDSLYTAVIGALVRRIELRTQRASAANGTSKPRNGRIVKAE